MRRAGNDTEILYSQEGTFLGFCLAADYCAEHEWGIDGICNIVQREQSDVIMGIERYRIGEVSTKNYFFQSIQLKKIKSKKEPKRYDLVKDGHFFILRKNINQYDLIDHLKSIFNCYECRNIGAGWNGESFGFHIKPQFDKEFNEFIDAFKNKDIAIYLGGSLGNNPFARSGLVIAIISKLDNTILDTIYNSHVADYELKNASEKTGIKKLIDDLVAQQRGQSKFSISPNKGYFALSPRWCREDEKGKTIHPVIYWLNPYHQNENNSGWFTVEELTAWAEDKEGNPISKSK